MNFKVLLAIFTAQFFCSCATLLNDSNTRIKVNTTSPAKITVQNDVYSTQNNRKSIYPARSKNELLLTISTDSITKTIRLKSKNSGWYYYNIIGNYGLGMLIDRRNPKRYSYPKEIFINTNDTSTTYKNIRVLQMEDREKKFFTTVSMPHINSFQMKPNAESQKINTGFWGFSLGVEYYYKKHKSMAIKANTVTDFFLPIPAAVDLFGEHQSLSSSYLSFTDNWQKKRFLLGYGLSFAKNTWRLTYIDRFDPPPPTRDPVKKSHYSLGLIGNSYYQLGKHFNLGLIYRPSFIRFGVDDSFRYEHLISVDFLYRFRI
jgi:hypothetical protein